MTKLRSKLRWICTEIGAVLFAAAVLGGSIGGFVLGRSRARRQLSSHAPSLVHGYRAVREDRELSNAERERRGDKAKDKLGGQ